MIPFGISSEKSKEDKKSIAIIGAGWYGAHLALHLQQMHEVTLIDRNPKPFSEISGTFGVRAHIGPHYPRSEATRLNCREGRAEFEKVYPEFINQHEHSIYAIGSTDADGKPSKVNIENFKQVCSESGAYTEIDLSNSSYKQVEFAADIPQESSLILGERLRTAFTEKFKNANIHTEYNLLITKVEKKDNKFKVLGAQSTDNGSMTLSFVCLFDQIINATSFKAHIPRTLPNPLKVIYQVCLALVYEDLSPKDKPSSIIMMDGWFPCVMPYDIRQNNKDPINYYILTHAKYTNVMTSGNLREAEDFLQNTVPSLIEQIKIEAEKEIARFWPEFINIFKYVAYKGVVLAKPKAESEFRSAITFQANDGIIHIVPGKVSDIFEVARESETLIQGNSSAIKVDGDFKYVKNGVLDKAREELATPLSGDRNTSNLQSHRILQNSLPISLAQSPSSSFKTIKQGSKLNGSTRSNTYMKERFSPTSPTMFASEEHEGTPSGSPSLSPELNK